MPRLLLIALALAACTSDTPASPSDIEPVDEVVPPAESPEDPTDPIGTDGYTTSNSDSLLSWIGEYPVNDDGDHFVLLPSVRMALEEALRVEPGLMSKLSNLDDEPYYLMTPIDDQGGALALTFVANQRMNEDQRTMWMLFDPETRAVFVMLAGESDTFYRASYDARIDDLAPEAIAWMEEESGTPFEEIARMSEETPMSP